MAHIGYTNHRKANLGESKFDGLISDWWSALVVYVGRTCYSVLTYEVAHYEVWLYLDELNFTQLEIPGSPVDCIDSVAPFSVGTSDIRPLLAHCEYETSPPKASVIAAVNKEPHVGFTYQLWLGSISDDVLYFDWRVATRDLTFHSLDGIVHFSLSYVGAALLRVNCLWCPLRVNVSFYNPSPNVIGEHRNRGAVQGLIDQGVTDPPIEYHEWPKREPAACTLHVLYDLTTTAALSVAGMGLHDYRNHMQWICGHSALCQRMADQSDSLVGHRIRRKLVMRSTRSVPL